MTDPTDVIRLYLDDDKEPFRTARPPLRFQFTTLNLADGAHRLRVEAHNGLAGAAIREIPFVVRNGVAIVVSGIEPNQEIAGQVGIIINAYAGNTEVDFEPQRAETPQPVPTYAWLVFLAVIAWAMFYMLNPAVPAGPVEAAGASPDLGEQVYQDTCAKCHQEKGQGLEKKMVPALHDADVVIDGDPRRLLMKVVGGPLPEKDLGPDAPGQGRSRIRMPAWGVRLTSEQIVAAINYIRTHLGNQAPPLNPVATRRPPKIDDLDGDAGKFALALQNKSESELRACFSSKPEFEPRLVRPDAVNGGKDKVDVTGVADVVKAYKGWWDGLKDVNSLSLVDASYDVREPRPGPGPGQYGTAYAHGTVLLNVTTREGKNELHTGRFIRTYVTENDSAGPCDPNIVPAYHWVVSFDFATLPMPIGCEMPGGAEPPTGVRPLCPPQTTAAVYYEDVQNLFHKLGQKAQSAPHENFWELPYEKFVRLEFAVHGLKDRDTGKEIPEGRIRLIAPGPSHETNLFKALRDGQNILVQVPGEGEPRHVNIERMPKGTKYMPFDDIDRIMAWIDAGMLKTAPVAPPPGPGMGTLPGGNVPPPSAPPGPPVTPNPNPPAAGAGDWKDDDVDYAGVQALFRALKKKPSGSPHGSFWEKKHEDFVVFQFDSTIPEGKIRLIEPGNGAGSNLVKALKDGKGVVVRLANGTTATADIARMPPTGPGMAAADIEKIRRWIDHGAPKEKPAGGAGDKKPPEPPPSVPPPAPPPTAAPPAPPPTAPGSDWREDDVDYAGVQAIFTALKRKAPSAPHGNFWRLPYEKFLDLEFPLADGTGKIKMIEKGNGAGSNLVKALVDGKSIVVANDDGTKRSVDIVRMPQDGPFLSAADIEKISRWIDHGAPRERPAR